VVAFLTSIIVGVLLTAVVLVVARRRAPGTPLTWGEAFVAATFVFAIFVFAYGVIPHQWLVWCDKELAWRGDKTGIPLGPLGKVLDNGKEAIGFIPVDKGVAWPEGITFFGRGRVLLNAEHIRDLVAATIYIMMLAGQFYLWAFWQKRGKVATAKAEREALSTSAYGRPLKKAEA